jgi:hypothetical protein
MSLLSKEERVAPPRGGWDCREFTHPFSNLNNTNARFHAREKNDDVNALEDARGNERLEETMEDDDDEKNAFKEHHNARDDDVMYGDEEEEEYISRAPNALVIAPTSSRDCGVTASLLFARCARECVCEDEDEEDDQDQEGERENAFVENEDINENSARRESLRRKEKDSGVSGKAFLPRALFVCRRDALESETFAAPSVYANESHDDDGFVDAKGAKKTKNFLSTRTWVPSEEYITTRAAKRVSIKYASTDEDVVKIMSALHVLPVEELPNLIAVCDVSAFSDRYGGSGMGGNRERTAAHARVCAAIVEAARYSTMAKRKATMRSHRDGWRSRAPARCKVVVSERKDDMEDANMLAKKDWQHDVGMDAMMTGGVETKYYNRNANVGTAANTNFHPLTYATKRWFERVFVVRKKSGYEEEVVEVGKIEGGAYEVIDCATGAKSTHIATLGVN